MTALIAWVLGNPTIIAIVAGVLGALGLGIQQRRAGAKAEKAKAAERDLKARNTADEIDDAVAGRAPSENRDRLAKWGKK